MMRAKIRVGGLIVALALVFHIPAQAQSEGARKATSMRPDPKNPAGENLDVPPDWIVRLDKQDPDVVIGREEEGSDIRFVAMTPGWHITTGPRAIYYHPASTAEGNYTARASIYLFPPGERNEAYGLFVGGVDLDSDSQQYLYFLIRRSGEFLVKRRAGDETEVVREWTAHDAINPYTEETKGTVNNVLAVQVGADAVSFLVNDVEVAQLPRSEVEVDGIVGLRINHALNVHVDDFGVEIHDTM
ncbi:MAG: hypothetical protein KJO98_11335 [Rhodothermia bacterium]|nr:hypothetical protein [Rhodothermia bacterium]